MFLFKNEKKKVLIFRGFFLSLFRLSSNLRRGGRRRTRRKNSTRWTRTRSRPQSRNTFEKEERHFHCQPIHKQKREDYRCCLGHCLQENSIEEEKGNFIHFLCYLLYYENYNEEKTITNQSHQWLSGCIFKNNTYYVYQIPIST